MTLFVSVIPGTALPSLSARVRFHSELLFRAFRWALGPLLTLFLEPLNRQESICAGIFMALFSSKTAVHEAGLARIRVYARMKYGSAKLKRSEKCLPISGNGRRLFR